MDILTHLKTMDFYKGHFSFGNFRVLTHIPTEHHTCDHIEF